MPAEITLPQMQQAIEQLSGSERGRNAIIDLSRFFDNGLMLDNQNRHAVMVLMGGVWGNWASTGTILLKQRAMELKTLTHGSPYTGPPMMELVGQWHEITSIDFFDGEDWGYAKTADGSSIGPISRSFEATHNKIKGDFSKLPTEEIYRAHNGGV